MLTLTTPSSPASPPRPPEFMDTRPARVGLLLRPRATAELSGSSRSTHRRARSVIAGGYLEERGRPGRGPAAGGGVARRSRPLCCRRGGHFLPPLRPVVAESWQRSLATGVDPDRGGAPSASVASSVAGCGPPIRWRRRFP